MRDEGVQLGAPNRVIDAVRDADKTVGAVAEKAFEAEAKFGGLYLLRVAGG